MNLFARLFQTISGESGNTKRWLILYAILLVLSLIYPYSFQIPFHNEENDVVWIHETNGVQFPTSGAIISPSPPKGLYAALVSGKGFTVEAWVTPASVDRQFFSRFISYSYDPYLRNFTLGQQDRDLFMRLRTTRTNLDGSRPELELKDALIPGKLHHIVVTYDFARECVYINGRKRMEAAIPGGDFSNWDPSYPLVLGNEATGNRPWRGRLFLTAIYDRCLTPEEVSQNFLAGESSASAENLQSVRVRNGLLAFYLFDEGSGSIVKDRSGSGSGSDLLIPKWLKVPDTHDGRYKRYIGYSFIVDKQEFKDIVLNVMAFLILGFLLQRMVAMRFDYSFGSAALILVVCMLFSFTAESLQYFINGRESDVTDIVSNTVGSVFGILSERALSLAAGITKR